MKQKKKNIKHKKNNNFLSNILIVLVALLVFFQLNISSNAESLKFVQFSDSHISDRERNSSYKYLTLSKDILKDAVMQVNLMPNVDFVMHTGDGVDTPKESLIDVFIDEMNKLNVPWYMTFGNHDISIDGDVTKKFYLSKLQNGNTSFTFDKPYYSFEPKKGFKVIGLDTIITGKITANGEIYEEEKNWLKKEIEQTPDNTFIMIFSHVPIKEPFSSPHHKLNNEAEMQELLKSFNRPLAVFNGHYHTTKIQRDGNIVYVSSPALVGFPYAFRVVNVTNGRKNIVIKLDYKKSGLEKLKQEGSGELVGVSLYLGGDKDRNTVIELEK